MADMDKMRPEKIFLRSWLHGTDTPSETKKYFDTLTSFQIVPLAEWTVLLYLTRPFPKLSEFFDILARKQILDLATLPLTTTYYVKFSGQNCLSTS